MIRTSAAIWSVEATGSAGGGTAAVCGPGSPILRTVTGPHSELGRTAGVRPAKARSLTPSST